MRFTGELAALGTAVCWTVTALSFEVAGKRIGSLVVNLLRLLLGALFLAAWSTVARGMPLPLDATAQAWFWLSLSGLVGFTIGDLCLFRAFVLIGSRLSMLLMALVPPLTALFGWLALGERLNRLDWLGMVLTLAGVVWAVFERPAGSSRALALPVDAVAPPVDAVAPPDAVDPPVAAVGSPADPLELGGGRVPFAAKDGDFALGIGLGLVGALGQAGGLILSKHGMGAYDPFAATQIRVLAGAGSFILLFTAIRWWGPVRAAFGDRRGLAFTGLGAFFGPFLGVSLSLLAIQATMAGVAATLMSLTPVLIVPAGALVFRETLTPRAMLAALLAVAGSALLFL